MRPMSKAIMVQGRMLDAAELGLIRQLLAENLSWNRTRLSRELCHRWDWRNARGEVKDMACRSLLLKLEQQGMIVLPQRQVRPANRYRNREIREVPHATQPLRCCLASVQPLSIFVVAPDTPDLALFRCLVSRYHYLGLKNTVGENMKYLVRARSGRPLGCLLFGAAAWKTAPRDQWIGWDAPCRERGLAGITNNTRFLILPWVEIPHLASHVLGRVARQIRGDWVEKYGHPVHLLETFVDGSRFRGTCYRAANWQHVGRTTGRTRQDRCRDVRVAAKDIYLYPLLQRYQEALIHGEGL